MKNIFRIFIDDFKRLIKNKIAIGITLGVIFIPGIYAWLNIDSNWDPYGNTEHIPIAVVNEDQGTTILGEDINIGQEVEQTLRQNHNMKWIFTDEANALASVEKGDYYAAMIIPKGFSADLSTIVSSGELKKPTFDFYVNNKKNAIAPIIANKAITTVQSSVNQSFVNTVVYKAVSTAEDFDILSKDSDAANSLINKLNEAKLRTEQLRNVLSATSLATDTTSKSLSALRNIIPTLKTANNTVAQGLGDLKNTVKSFNTTYTSTEEDLTTILDKTETIVKDLSALLDPSSIIAKQLAKQLAQIEEVKAYLANTKNDLDGLYQRSSQGIDNATSTLLNLNSSLDSADLSMSYMINALDSGKQLTTSLDTILSDFQSDIDQIILTVQEVGKSELYQNLANLLKNSPSNVADFLSTPVEVNNIAVYPIDNYGSEMAPFYSVLACWVGCTILATLFKTGVKEAPKRAKDYQKFFGRFTLFGLVAALQGLVIGIGDLAVLRIQIISWPLFLLTLMLSSVIFMLIIYALTVVFGKIGQALSIVLLVIQVAGSGGTYPIELLPRFFQVLQPFMPFYPSMNAARETIGGFYDNNYLMYIGILLCHIIIPLLLGLVFNRYTTNVCQKAQLELHETGIIG